jgi:hypothetical protein
MKKLQINTLRSCNPLKFTFKKVLNDINAVLRVTITWKHWPCYITYKYCWCISEFYVQRSAGPLFAVAV